MKKLKILFLFTLISSVFFYSCSNSKSDEVTTQKSLSLRVALQEIKNTLPNSGKITSKTDNDTEMCFDFVYPITLSYNTGTTVVVNSFEELIALLESESETQYLEGISFPFQVISSADATITTINTESDFVNQLEACGYDSYDDSVIDSSCFQIIYPFSITNSQNQVTVINNEAQLIAYVESSNDEELLPVFPFSVMQNGQVVTVNNEYQLYELSDSCDNVTDCVCNTLYAPVCVVNSEGTLQQFDNPCAAECEGYTTSDFVNCN